MMADDEALACFALVVGQQKVKRRKRVAKKFLLPVGSAPLHLVYQRTMLSGAIDHGTFEKLFRLDVSVFKTLLRRFCPAYERSPMHPSTSKSIGRPGRRLFDARNALLLMLRKLASNVGLDNGSLLTGGSPETIARTFDHGLHVLTAVLEKWSAARMSFPSPEEAQRLAELGREYCEKRGHSCPGDFIGFLDGTIKERERPGDNDYWQHANYNGKSNSHAYKVLLVQLFNG